ncbi:MAG: hypothetical protein RL418_717, partial [Actinomycetota bacterium]
MRSKMISCLAPNAPGCISRVSPIAVSTIGGTNTNSGFLTKGLDLDTSTTLKLGAQLASKSRRDAAKQAAQSGNMSPKEIWLVLIGLMSGMFLAALDQSVVGAAMRTIADDLGGLSLQAWATTAYLITSTVS